MITAIGTSSLSFDNNGNTTVDDAGHHLVYDAWNHVVGVYNDNGSGGTGTLIKSYAYDGLGRRITVDTPTTLPIDSYFTANWQVIEEDINNGGALLSAQYVWSPVYVDAMVERDYDFTDNQSFQVTERVFVLQDAAYNTTALVQYHGISADGNLDGVVNSDDYYNFVVNHWNYVGPGGDVVGDLNHDGVVNVGDVNFIGTY